MRPTAIDASNRLQLIEPSSIGNAETVNLLDYLEVIAKHNRMIIFATVAALVISTIISLLIPPRYSATTRILPPQQDSGIAALMMGAAGGMGGLAADLLGKGSPADLYVGILSSEAVSDIIIDRFKLMELYDQKYRASTYNELDKNVDIVVGKRDGIITITVEDTDPKRAAQIANTYVEELGKLLVKLNVTGAGQNRDYLEERLAKSKTDLARSEDALKAFQLKNKALDITEQAKGTIKGVADLEGQLATEEVRLASLRRVFSDNSQDVKNQRAIVANIKGQIAKFEGNRTGSAMPGIGSAPETGQQYLRLMREFKIQETLVEMLTKQFEIAKLSEAKDVTPIQVIQSARIPDKKSKPKRAIIVFVSTFAILVASMISAFTIEYLNTMSEEDRLHWCRITALLKTSTKLSTHAKDL